MGEHLSVRPGLLDVGEGAAGEVHESAVELVNWTGHPIRVIGGTSDCNGSIPKKG